MSSMLNHKPQYHKPHSPKPFSHRQSKRTSPLILTGSIQGFTLIEMMVTVVILALVAVIAYPSFMRQLANMEARRVANLISTSLSSAKVNSFTTRKNVFVCILDDSGACHRDGQHALLLFDDMNRDNRFDVHQDRVIEQHHLGLKYGHVMFRVSLGKHYAKFWGDTGLPRGHIGHVSYCSNTAFNDNHYQISFNTQGIVRYKTAPQYALDC